jgi:poly-gamma-glutamate synthesis protein (capsule biosynthesis protein)
MPYESESGDLTLALSGETMITRPLTIFKEPKFLELRDLLHSADVRYSHGEMLFRNFENPQGPALSFRCDPRYIKDLQWFGINLLSCAHNHAFDFGEGGIATNKHYLDQAGMVSAGTGRNLAEAVAPAYLDTPRGRVALISATTTGLFHSRAGEQRRDLQGRPGTNLIRWIYEWTVDDEAFSALRRVAQNFNWTQRVPPWLSRGYAVNDGESDDVVLFVDRNTLGNQNALGQLNNVNEDPAARFVRGSAFERHTRIHRGDFQRNIQAVEEARRMADWVIYSIHNHEGGKTTDEPSEHVRELVHAVIDAGADVVVGHGCHQDRGIEVYNGKPIIYSLGDFIVQDEFNPKQSHDRMVLAGLGHDDSVVDLYDGFISSRKRVTEIDQLWWSAIPVISFEQKRLCQIRLHPIEWGFGLPRTQAGRPMLAEGDLARKVLQRFKRLSEPFGTTIELEGDVGVIRAN